MLAVLVGHELLTHHLGIAIAQFDGVVAFLFLNLALDSATPPRCFHITQRLAKHGASNPHGHKTCYRTCHCSEDDAQSSHDHAQDCWQQRKGGHDTDDHDRAYQNLPLERVVFEVGLGAVLDQMAFACRFGPGGRDFHPDIACDEFLLVVGSAHFRLRHDLSPLEYELCIFLEKTRDFVQKISQTALLLVRNIFLVLYVGAKAVVSHRLDAVL